MTAAVSQLSQLVAHAQQLQQQLAGGQKLSAQQVVQIRQAAHASAQLQLIAEQTPLALARLWRPHCCRWDLDKKRPRGCGREMVPMKVLVSRQGRLGEDTAAKTFALEAAGHHQQARELLEPLEPGLLDEEAQFDAAGGIFTCASPDCAMYGKPEARTSQRDAIRTLARIATLVSGANRAGKTSAALQYGVAVAGGRSSPWVRAWMEANQIPEHLIPEKPGRVCISALTHKDSLKYHRPALKALLPAGTKLRKWGADDEAGAVLPEGGEILLKAARQGREAYQGDQYDLVVLDEEHPEPVFEECLRGTADRAGRLVLSMTPLKGITWPHKVFLGTQKWAGTAECRIYGLDNPHVRSRELIERFRHLAEDKRRARLYGEWGTARGLVWPQFRRAIHFPQVAPALGDDWPRYRCLDFGINFACLWTALDPQTDTLHVYRELKTYDVPLGANAQRIHQMSGAEKYVKTLADPAGAEERKTLRRSYNMPTSKAKKAVEAGIDAVAQRLALAGQGHTRLVIHPCCVELVAEIEAYKRKDDGTIKKQDDHLCDTLRYTVYELAWRKGMGASS